MSIEKLKILQIIPNLKKGGAERLVLDICRELSERAGVEVKLVCLSQENEYPFLTNNVDYTVIPSKYIPSITGKPIVDIQNLQEFIDNFQPHIIHSHLWEAEIISRQVNYTTAKWFSHFHDNMVQLSKFSFPITKQKVTNYYERTLLLNRYKRVNNNFICIAKHSFNYAKANLPQSLLSNVHLLHNAINTRKFSKKSSIEHSDEILKLINVGSMVDKKNQLFLIEVVKELKQKGVKVHLSLLGDGVNIQLLSNKIVDYKLENEVTLHGNVNNPEEYYWASNIYVHSAKYEPLGLVLLEAMAAQLPVVTLNGYGNRDIVEQGKNGYMIFEENGELFAETIIELWNNKELYKKMSNYAVEYAQQYDIKEYCCKLIELYKTK